MAETNIALTSPRQSGAGVRRWQEMLVLAGYATAVDVDGVYGPGTADQTKAVQKELLVPVTGTVDQATWDGMLKLLSGLYTKTSDPKLKPQTYPAANFFLVDDKEYRDAKTDYAGLDPQRLVYAEAWDGFENALLNSPKPKGQKLKYLQFERNAGAKGLAVNIYGDYTPSDQVLQSLPKDSTGPKKMRILLQYLHLSKFAVTKDGVMGADYTGNGNSIVVNKGDIVGYVGNTGLSSSPHLHVNMYILGPNSGTDPNLYKFAAKANEEFLTAQLIAKATNYKFDSKNPITPEMLNHPVDNRWLSFASKGKKDGGKVTAADFMNRFLNDSDYNGSFLMATRYKNKSGAWTRRIQTNPLFYFRLDELVKYSGPIILRAAEPKSYAARHTPPPPGARYVSSTPWCGGLTGTKTKAASTAQASKAKADANRQIATNPAKADEAKEKLKAKLTKAEAPVKAAEAAAARARSQPDAVRRKYDALANKAREQQKSPSVVGRTVSPPQNVTK